MNSKFLKQGSIGVACVILLIAILWKISSPTVERFDGIPANVIDYMQLYLSAYKDGPSVSVDYCHFEIEQDQRSYINSGPSLEKYEIIDVKKVNENLYAFSLNMWFVGNKHFAYNFVGKIDGEWKVMNNVIHIPDELRENLNADDYEYDAREGFQILDREDVCIIN